MTPQEISSPSMAARRHRHEAHPRHASPNRNLACRRDPRTRFDDNVCSRDGRCLCQSQSLRHRRRSRSERQHPKLLYRSDAPSNCERLRASYSIGPAPAANVGDVIANACTVAAKGDAKNNKLNCNVGPTVLVEQIKEISGKFDITEHAALTLLRILGEDATIADDKLANALVKVAQDYKRLKAQVAALSPDNPATRSLVEQAKPEIDAVRRACSRAVAPSDRSATCCGAGGAQAQGEAQAAEDAQMLGAASSTAAEGNVTLTERDYQQAAELFARAASYIPSGHPIDRVFNTTGGRRASR